MFIKCLQKQKTSFLKPHNSRFHKQLSPLFTLNGNLDSINSYLNGKKLKCLFCMLLDRVVKDVIHLPTPPHPLALNIKSQFKNQSKILRIFLEIFWWNRIFYYLAILNWKQISRVNLRQLTRICWETFGQLYWHIICFTLCKHPGSSTRRLIFREFKCRQGRK